MHRFDRVADLERGQVAEELGQAIAQNHRDGPVDRQVGRDGGRLRAGRLRRRRRQELRRPLGLAADA